MKERINKLLKDDDSGEIMLESTIVISITLLIMLVMISMGFVYYQKAMLTSVANEIASDIGANYKYLSSDNYKLNDMTFDSDTLTSLGKFRATFQLQGMKESCKKKAEEYIAERVGLTNLGINRREPTVDSVEVSVDGIGRMHVTVKISMETDFLFSGVLEYLDIIPESPTFTATGSAECLDVASYFSYANFVSYFTDKIVGKNTIIGKIDSIIITIKDWFA